MFQPVIKNIFCGDAFDAWSRTGSDQSVSQSAWVSWFILTLEDVGVWIHGALRLASSLFYWLVGSTALLTRRIIPIWQSNSLLRQLLLTASLAILEYNSSACMRGNHLLLLDLLPLVFTGRCRSNKAINWFGASWKLQLLISSGDARGLASLSYLRRGLVPPPRMQNVTRQRKFKAHILNAIYLTS